MKWELLLNTGLEEGFPAMPELSAAGDEYVLMERSFSLFRLNTGAHSHARTESWKKRDRKPPEPEPAAKAAPAPATAPKSEKPQPDKPAKTKAKRSP